jgi:hypothetical protein
VFSDPLRVCVETHEVKLVHLSKVDPDARSESAREAVYKVEGVEEASVGVDNLENGAMTRMIYLGTFQRKHLVRKVGNTLFSFDHQSRFVRLKRTRFRY